MNREDMENRLGLSPGELLELWEIFLEASHADLAGIQAGLDDNDPGRVAEAAHSIKGSAINLEFVKVAEQAEGIEREAKKGNLAGVREQTPLLRESFKEVASMIYRYSGLCQRQERSCPGEEFRVVESR